MVPEGLLENFVRPLSLTGLTYGYAPDVSRRSRADCTKARENNIKHKEAKATVHTLYCCCVCTYRSVGRSGNPEGLSSISGTYFTERNPTMCVLYYMFAIFGQFDRKVVMYSIRNWTLLCKILSILGQKTSY